MNIKTLHDAFAYELSDMYNAEKQLTEALPKLAKAASDPNLVEAFEMHLVETQEQIQLIEKVAKMCELELAQETCEAMEGLIKEGHEVIDNVEEGPVKDCMLIAAAQKVEHYEIASYGTLIAMAEKLDFTEALDFLRQILDQEKYADQKLNRLAEQDINDKALRAA